MTQERDELSGRLAHTLERSLDNIDDATRQQLQQRRRDALQPRFPLRPAMAIAASLVALVLVPWLTLRTPDAPLPDAIVERTFVDSVLELSTDTGYLGEDPDLLADWEMLDAIGEVPDA